jgi:hypothetical protein
LLDGSPWATRHSIEFRADGGTLFGEFVTLRTGNVRQLTSIREIDF